MNIQLEDGQIHSENSVNFLGLQMDEHLKSETHIHNVCKIISKGIFVLRNLSKTCTKGVLLTVYYSLIVPHLKYAVIIWGRYKTKIVFTLQKKALRVIFKLKHKDSCEEIFKVNKILTFTSI